MTEETVTTEPQTEETPEPQPTDDPRSTPAFRAVLKQLEEERAARQKLEQAQQKEKEAAERKRLEEEGNYKEALAQAIAKAEAAEARALDEARRAKLALAGVSDKDHADFLLLKFRAAEAEDMEQWIAEARESESLKPFFGLAEPAERTGLPPGNAEKAVPRSTTKAFTRDDLRNPATASDAARWFEAYVSEHGKKPW
jgi:hypothetical protein